MTEQNPNPDATDDTEGHVRRAPEDPGDMAGLDSMDDDTEGHARMRAADDIDDEDDDVEGHLRKPR